MRVIWKLPFAIAMCFYCLQSVIDGLLYLKKITGTLHLLLHPLHLEHSPVKHATSCTSMCADGVEHHMTMLPMWRISLHTSCSYVLVKSKDARQ